MLAKDQPDYLPLPVFQDNGQGGRTISCWKLSLKERFILLFTGRLWLCVLNFHRPLQPQLPTVINPWLKQNYPKVKEKRNA